MTNRIFLAIAVSLIEQVQFPFAHKCRRSADAVLFVVSLRQDFTNFLPIVKVFTICDTYRYAFGGRDDGVVLVLSAADASNVRVLGKRPAVRVIGIIHLRPAPGFDVG